MKVIQNKTAKSAGKKSEARRARSKRPAGWPERRTIPKSHFRSALCKQDRVVAMLRRPNGTTVAAVVKATGWKKHSVRAFFSAVVRGRLGLDLVSNRDRGVRSYRVIEPGSS